MKKYFLYLVLVVAAVLTAVVVNSCNKKDDPEPGDTTVAVTGVTVSPSTLTLAEGASSAALVATVTPSDATNKAVVWSVAATATEFVEVSENGVVTALKITTAPVDVIATTVDGGRTAVCKVTVVSSSNFVNVTGVEVTPKTLTLAVDESSEPLSVTVTPEDATEPGIVWSVETEGEAIIEISQDGVVTAKAPGGPFKVIATSVENDEITDFCEVTVVQPVTGVTVSPKTLTIAVGGDIETLEATVAPANASNQAIVWSVEEGGEIFVGVDENGVLTAIAVTTTPVKVIATTVDGEHTDFCEVTVVQPITPTGISLSETEVLFVQGETTVTLTVTFDPPGTTEKDIEWTLDPPGVVTVDVDGKLTFVSRGKTVITATSAANNDVTASCNVIAIVPNLLNKALFVPALRPGDNSTPYPNNNGTPETGWQSAYNTANMNERCLRAIWDGNTQNPPWAYDWALGGESPIPMGGVNPDHPRGILHTRNYGHGTVEALQNSAFKYPHTFTFSIGDHAVLSKFKFHLKSDGTPFTEHGPRYFELWATDELKTEADFANNAEFLQYYMTTYVEHVMVLDNQIRDTPNGEGVSRADATAMINPAPAPGIYNWQQDWVMLRDIEIVKPSQLNYIVVNDDDREIVKGFRGSADANINRNILEYGFDFNMPYVDKKMKYIRIVVKYPNWGLSNIIVIGEVTFWGDTQVNF